MNDPDDNVLIYMIVSALLVMSFLTEKMSAMSSTDFEPDLDIGPDSVDSRVYNQDSEPSRVSFRMCGMGGSNFWGNDRGGDTSIRIPASDTSELTPVPITAPKGISVQKIIKLIAPKMFVHRDMEHIEQPRVIAPNVIAPTVVTKIVPVQKILNMVAPKLNMAAPKMFVHRDMEYMEHMEQLNVIAPKVVTKIVPVQKIIKIVAPKMFVQKDMEPRVFLIVPKAAAPKVGLVGPKVVVPKGMEAMAVSTPVLSPVALTPISIPTPESPTRIILTPTVLTPKSMPTPVLTPRTPDITVPTARSLPTPTVPTPPPSPPSTTVETGFITSKL